MRNRLTVALLLLSSFVPFGVAAEGKLPTAQELVAIVEVGGAQCVKAGHATEQDQVALRRYVSSLFRKRSYQEYAETPEFSAASEKANEDIKRNGLAPALCGWLRKLPLLAPDQVMFFEPGK